MLQGTDRHVRSGVMKAHWNGQDYDAMEKKPLEFTPDDIDLIVSGLTARKAQTAGETTATKCIACKGTKMIGQCGHAARIVSAMMAMLGMISTLRARENTKEAIERSGRPASSCRFGSKPGKGTHARRSVSANLPDRLHK